MRLIDADKLIELTQKDMKYAFDNGFLDMAFEREHLIKVIRNQPTAYDIDKVIDELELHSFELGTDTIPVHYVRLNEAIEIVNQGGVSDNMCEWKYTKEIMDNAEFKVGCNQNALKKGTVPNNFSYHDFKYCPYCGRRIKIVGD